MSSGAMEAHGGHPSPQVGAEVLRPAPMGYSLGTKGGRHPGAPRSPIPNTRTPFPEVQNSCPQIPSASGRRCSFREALVPQASGLSKAHHHTCHRSRKSEEIGRAPPPTSNKPLGALSLPGRQPLRTAASAPGPQIMEAHVTRVTSLCCAGQAQGPPSSTWPSGSGSPVHQHVLQGSLGPRGAEHPGVPLPAVHLPGQREARACRPQAEIKADVREANYPETAADC